MGRGYPLFELSFEEMTSNVDRVDVHHGFQSWVVRLHWNMEAWTVKTV